MQDISPVPASRDTPVYGYASFPPGAGGIDNEELRRQAEMIAADCERLGLVGLMVGRRDDFHGSDAVKLAVTAERAQRAAIDRDAERGDLPLGRR